jgi:hypothetical protein
MSKFLNTSEFIIMINSRHILNLSMELIIKAQAIDKTFQEKSLKKLWKSFKKEKKFKKLDFQKSLKS